MSTNIHKELTLLRSQLEYWNNGLWEIGHWFIRKITVDMGASMLVAKSSSLRSTFQYSMCWAKAQASKNPFIFSKL
jgi:hypothetical protein